MVGGLEESELLDGPHLDGDIGESLSQRLGGLLRAQEWRDDEESWFAGNPIGEVHGLSASKVGQGIGVVVGGLAAGVADALTMADKNDLRGRLRCRFGHGLLSRAGVVSLLSTSRGIFAESTAWSLWCSTFAEFNRSRIRIGGSVWMHLRLRLFH